MNLKQNKYIGFTPYWSNTLTLSTINITFYDLVYVAQEKVYNWPKSYIFFHWNIIHTRQWVHSETSISTTGEVFL